MLVIIGVACLNECKAGKRTVGKIGKVGRQRSNVVRIDAEAVRRIANHTGWLSGRGTGSTGGILINILVRIGQGGECSRRIRRVCGAGAVIRVETEALGDRVVNLPRDLGLVKFLEDVRYVE